MQLKTRIRGSRSFKSILQPAHDAGTHMVTGVPAFRYDRTRWAALFT
jgi:hypothetical protein